jgi:pimeloyl-ACP methyl ester carboxylesterase
MDSVVSKDGTRIAYERFGDSGPAAVFVGGNLDDGAESAPLAAELSSTHRVFNFARRGRGESGDTPPYTIMREIEDIAALIEKAGGTAHLYGVSSGGSLALEAAMAGLPVRSVAVYEVPYDLDDDTPRQQAEYAAELNAMLEAGRRGDALTLFMRLAGSTEADIDSARNSPYWPALEKIAPTLAYDAVCLGTRQPPLDGLALLTIPALVVTGGSVPPFEQAADAMSRALPAGKRVALSGQAHVVDPNVLAPVLKEFWTAVN